LKEIWRLNDLLMKPAMWLMGGDGWANDIGFGGIDHAVALGVDINILILDTEVYSNTGGQSSKATPLGSVAKFAQNGRRQQKKDLGGLLMSYQNVYVASCSMGASHPQVVKSLTEAEAHKGPSIVICYAPCIEHRTKNGMGDTALDMKKAVDCGYWPLYRYDPARIEAGEPPFQLDSTQLTSKVEDFLMNQNRYSQLQRSQPEEAEMLRKELNDHLMTRFDGMKTKSKTKISLKYDALPSSQPKAQGPEITVAYGSDTGTAETVARRFAKLIKGRGCTVQLSDVNELDVSMPQTIVMFVATCGDGDIPPNAKSFYQNDSAGIDKQKFLVFALGDRGYAKFCEAGKLFDAKFSKGGAKQLKEIAFADACDEDGWETQFNAWLPEALKILNVPEASTSGPPPPPFKITESTFKYDSTYQVPQLCPAGAVLAEVTCNERMTPVEYERDVRHFTFSTKDVDLPFHLGDAVALYPENPAQEVADALQWFGIEPDTALCLEPVDDTLSARMLALGNQRTTGRQLMTEVMDLVGKPTRSFYKQLALFANAQEAKDLFAISEGDKFKELQDESVSHWDIFKKFPSAKPDLSQLIGLLPAIKPRLYSIANSADYTPGCVELTIVINQWQPKAGGALKTGTSTKYVAGVKTGSRVAVAMTHGTFSFPKDELTPMVMTGLGTGIAPIRSFVQDRMYKKAQGIDVGPMVVFYGCRHQHEEFFYKEEWKQYEQAGVLTKLINAFSHDPPHYPPKMLFVNQKMDEHHDLLGDLLGKRGGYFYFCGLSIAVPGIDKALTAAAVSAEMTTDAKKDEWLAELKRTGRYSQESY
jgi:sulfite reductase alpha subunit-like flavoprotein